MNERKNVPVIDWLEALAAQTQAFQIKQADSEVKLAASNGRMYIWDYVIHLLIHESKDTLRLYVEAKCEVTPQTALAVLPRIVDVPRDGIPLLCALTISLRVAEMCREKGVSYLDAAGNCRITGSELFIQIEGRPNEAHMSRPLLDLFAPKSSRVIRILLSWPNRGWQVQTLAQEADVSLGLASKVKAALVREAFATERDRLIYVREPIKLLNQWTANYHPSGRMLSLFTLGRPAEAEEKIGQWCRENSIIYELTQLAGAWRVAPMVRYDRSTLYILRRPSDSWSVDSLIEAVGARRVDTGANLHLWITAEEGVFYDRRDIGGVSVASPLQLFLDLHQLAGRGEEAATEVFEREIRPLFNVLSNSRE